MVRIKTLYVCSSFFLYYYIKQIDSMLPCVCSVIDHRRRQNVVRTSVTHSAIASCATFLFLPHFAVICDLLLDMHIQGKHGIYSLNKPYKLVVYCLISLGRIIILCIWLERCLSYETVVCYPNYCSFTHSMQLTFSWMPLWEKCKRSLNSFRKVAVLCYQV